MKGEKPYEDDQAAVADSDTESNWSEWNEPAAAGTESTNDDAVAGSSGKQEETTAVAVARPLSAAAAEQLGDSQNLVAAYKQAMEALKACGAMTAVQQLDNEVRKELRRQRVAATGNPAVAEALLELKKARQSAEVENRLAVRNANKKGQGVDDAP